MTETPSTHGSDTHGSDTHGVREALARLEAGLDTDERLARAATGNHWRWEHDSPPEQTSVVCLECDSGYTVLAPTYSDSWLEVADADAAHIEHHDPAATLARTHAVRDAITLCRDALDSTEPGHTGSGRTCPDTLAAVITALAAAYPTPEHTPPPPKP